MHKKYVIAVIVVKIKKNSSQKIFLLLKKFKVRNFSKEFNSSAQT